jgi:outer membrane protein OmpA-like peptidoglycan-associated protein
MSSRLNSSAGMLLGIVCVAAVLQTAVPASAYAQNVASFPAERMRVSLNREGLIDVEWGRVLPHLRFDTGLFLSYAKNPLTLYRLSDGKRVGSLVQDRFGGSLFGTLGLFDWVEVGIEVPLILYQGRPANQPSVSETTLPSLSVVGFGDLRLQPKVRLLRSDKQGIDLAVLLSVYFPTAMAGDFRGDRTVVFAPEIAVSRAWRGPRIAANLGVTLRGRSQFLTLTADHEVSYRLGAGYRFKDIGRAPFEIDLSLAGAFALSRPFSNFNQNALELRAQVSYEFANMIEPFLGAGVGLARGFGTPDWRIFAGVRFGYVERKEPATQPSSTPASIPASAPVVVLIPDTDEDGILDDEDTCIEQPEDKDGFEDADGCPDPDNDQDGVLDVVDACPVNPGPAANRGCPDTDRDGDTVVDRLDNCPDEPGTVDNHGCKAKQLVVVTADRLELLDAVYFDTGKDTIQKKSFDLLDNVAAVVTAHPEIKKLFVDGHTDNVGKPALNRDLSQRRANSVKRYLVSKGVSADLLDPRGFGDTKPIVPNSSEKGRAKNRRVEFLIEQ